MRGRSLLTRRLIRLTSSPPEERYNSRGRIPPKDIGTEDLSASRGKDYSRAEIKFLTF
jgi:hypothetical protein